MAPKISPHSTIESIWKHLTSPREYVAGVRHKMRLCAQQHGRAYVCIGIKGTGQKPCYRIVYKPDDQGPSSIYGSYWENHEPLGKEDAVNSNWSDAYMTFEQIETLLKDIIATARKR